MIVLCSWHHAINIVFPRQNETGKISQYMFLFFINSILEKWKNFILYFSYLFSISPILTWTDCLIGQSSAVYLLEKSRQKPFSWKDENQSIKWRPRDPLFPA